MTDPKLLDEGDGMSEEERALAKQLRLNADSGDSCVGVSEDMRRAAASIDEAEEMWELVAEELHITNFLTARKIKALEAKMAEAQKELSEARSDMRSLDKQDREGFVETVGYRIDSINRLLKEYDAAREEGD